WLRDFCSSLCNWSTFSFNFLLASLIAAAFATCGGAALGRAGVITALGCGGAAVDGGAPLSVAGPDVPAKSLCVPALSCTRRMLSLIFRPRYSTMAGCQSA